MEMPIRIREEKREDAAVGAQNPNLMADARLPERRRPDEVEEKKREDSSKKQKVEIPSEYNGTMAESEDDEDYDGHSDDEEAETVDPKGKEKEIVINEKGKGKIIVDSSDSSDDSDSDLEDDLLAEIDLDNILPSRTRNRTAQAGLHISSNCDNNNKDTGA